MAWWDQRVSLKMPERRERIVYYRACDGGPQLELIGTLTWEPNPAKDPRG